TANIAVNLEGNNWRVTPNALSLTFSEKNQTTTKTVQVENLSTESADNTTLQFSYEGQELLDLHQISYDHIAEIVWFPPAKARLRSIYLINPVKNVAYVAGAGDLIPEALRAIGTQVDIIDVSKATLGQLQSYDALIRGLRAMNVNP